MGLEVENEAGKEVGDDSWALDLGAFLPFTEGKVFCAREAGGKMAHSWSKLNRKCPSGGSGEAK